MNNQIGVGSLLTLMRQGYQIQAKVLEVKAGHVLVRDDMGGILWAKPGEYEWSPAHG